MKRVNVKVIETIRKDSKYTTSLVVVSVASGDKYALVQRENGTPIADGVFFSRKRYHCSPEEQCAHLRTLALARFAMGKKTPLSLYSRVSWESLCGEEG